MTDKVFPQSQLPIRRTVELLPKVFQSSTNDKFLSAVLDPLTQPGVLQKVVGYSGRRYGKTYNGTDIYIDTDQTLRSRYQLEPAVIYKNNNTVENFYDYLDLKNQLVFFGNRSERDDKITSQEHYSWNPPISWDKFINYREYFWVPLGPPSVSVFGQSQKVISSYKVSLGVGTASFVLTPDGLTNNPIITLYRGQTYKFKVNAPGEGFVIRTNYDTGSLIWNPILPYSAGQQVVYDSKLWKARAANAPGTIPSVESAVWELLDDISSGSSLDYNNGVTNNGSENGTVTFKVPFDAPDVLYYQGKITPDRFGKIVVADIQGNTKIDILKEIVGKSEYLSSNDVAFTNGLVVNFRGNVFPEQYAQGDWLVEGVGTAITLTKFSDLIVPSLSTEKPEVLFDNVGFDTDPFDDATAYPGTKDYITIARDSVDCNAWSRYNRWFHRSVLEYAYASRGVDFDGSEDSRAKRPIIEFNANIQLYRHGAVCKTPVDYIDDFTTDIFSKIEGSAGYNVDNEFLFEGARVLVTADTDSLANNKIYEVKFIRHNNSTQITLRETSDSASLIGQGVLVKRGKSNANLMYHFNGTNWIKSQQKNSVNQSPLFDVFDSNEVSYGNSDTYGTTSFNGSKLLSYKVGNGFVDTELGFNLSYLNIDNVGDIQFEWNWDIDTFEYTENQQLKSKKISTGFYKDVRSDAYKNAWVRTDLTFIQPIIDGIVITASTNSVTLTSVNWDTIPSSAYINFYLNGKRLTNTYTRSGTNFIFDNITFKEKDAITVKIIADVAPDSGYYEIPVGLEKNPLNADLTTFTLGQAADHLSQALEFDRRLIGSPIGSSNLRDLNDYQQHAKRFMKHSGSAPLAVYLLADKKNNIIKSIQYAKKSYTEFKNNFIARSTELPFNSSVVDFVDDIIASLGKTKTATSPFVDSDMIGSGAYSAIRYEVEDTGIKVFALSEKFDLTRLSRRAVYVYLNGNQLFNATDYVFDSTFGFVRVSTELTEGDILEIREYVSTAINYIPPTPTSLGLYKKFKPMKFIDDTYRDPKYVIQGHDGSLTVAFNDFRDDLLLELEYRIYNNIKQEYDTTKFNIDDIIGGYYRTATYSKSQLDDIVVQEFLKWIQNTNINYTLNNYFVDTEPFTYTYSNMTDPTGEINLPGYWRGVYQWFYDTDRPHRCPWEMLGFSEEPAWWQSEYGAAPYTSGNLVLWGDLAAGIIKQGANAGVNEKYKRPSLLQHIPVDGDGKLLSPLDSGLATNFTLINNKGPFKLGDISPVEYSWRSSSEWPFAIMTAMSLMKPFEFIPESFDRSRTLINKLGQTVDANSQLFLTSADLVVPTPAGAQTSGLVQYLVSYIRSQGASVALAETKIKGLDVALSNRLSGFVDKAQHRYLLDSKSPRSSSSSIYIPPENYDIIFNTSAPIASVSYSGVILEKSEGGWIVTGYDDQNPYFSLYEAIPNQSDPVVTVGGVSATFSDWAAAKTYSNGQIVRYRNDFFRALQTHLSTATFEKTQWQKLPKLPVVGGVEALRRRNFNKVAVKQLSYGTKLTSIQAVADFLLGYQSYLESIGFKFDQYDTENAVSLDWTTSTKEFMFWTRHNWAIGSLITLSPGAKKLDITIPVGVADNLLDGFYDYQVLKADGKVLPSEYIDVSRSFQNAVIQTTNTTEGIFYLKVYYVLKEHVTVFSDRTVFNDIIYDKTTGYRQERVKVQGFRTVDWDGDYTSPGFLFDNVEIAVWQPFVDYRLGDIVAYKSYFWTSQVNQLGTETFNEVNWTKLDSTPDKSLVANFDYRINQFDDYYDAASDGLGDSQRMLARHAIGYQTREYLQNIVEDPVTQFQLYQGFIREKGTANAITKVFDKLSKGDDASIELKEEWAFRVGRLGGLDQLTEIEMNLEKDKFLLNPQPMQIVTSLPARVLDRYYRIEQSDFTVAPTPFTTNINPSAHIIPLRTSGYTRTDQVEYVLKTRDDILDLNIADVADNSHLWITFDGTEWTVLRFQKNSVLAITAVERNDDDTTQVVITLSRPHSFIVGNIIGITEIRNLTGFYKISKIVSNVSFEVTIEETAQDPVFDETVVASLSLFIVARQPSYDILSESAVALLKTNSKLWIDNNGENEWEVIEKKQQFMPKPIVKYGITGPKNTGIKVLYDDNLKQTFVSIPGTGAARTAFVMVYIESTDELVLKQIVTPDVAFDANVSGSFGKKTAISPDSRFLIVASPNATTIRSPYLGQPFNSAIGYVRNDIVVHNSRVWRALAAITPGFPIDTNNQWSQIDAILGDIVLINDVLYKATKNIAAGTAINLTNGDWIATNKIEANSESQGRGFQDQGMISIYEYVAQRWVLKTSLVSPRPAAREQFGSEVTIGKNGSTYYLAVSAVGSLNEPNGTAASGKGRVYIFKYDSSVANSFFELGSQYAIPQQAAFSSSSYTGQLIETIKFGDQFGFSMTMNSDASVLVVGAPFSDGQYFENYRGVWNSTAVYNEGDVVKHNEYYYLLPSNNDSTVITSVGQVPSAGVLWQITGDSSITKHGEVFVYQRDTNNAYQLKQVINAGTLPLLGDGSTANIFPGDQFGTAMDIDSSGVTLVVTSPLSDLFNSNQGAVYIFRTTNVTNVNYQLHQVVSSFEDFPDELFGSAISISSQGNRIAIGAQNNSFFDQTSFDVDTTIFDEDTTRFFDITGYIGAVYVFELKTDRFFLAEKLQVEQSPFEAFGDTIDCSESAIVVGSPKYVAPITVNGVTTYNGPEVGIARLFRKADGVDSWEVIGSQTPTVSLDKVRSIILYDNVLNQKIQDVDYVDHAKLKILNIAEQELKFKTLYDPAVYSIGTEEVVVDDQISWTTRHVGELWWDLSAVKWVYYEQGDFANRIGNWNAQAGGSSIDVYEWVESALLPSEWSALADTTEGIAEGISGQPKFPNDDVYTSKILFSNSTGLPTGTLYYYWVKNKVTLPRGVPGRRNSASYVASLINNPVGSGIAFIALVDSDKFIAYNFGSIIRSDTALLNIQYINTDKTPNAIHNEYQLLTEGVADSLPTQNLETKWLDSLIGFNQLGNKVPDNRLPAKQKYGLSFRPRQSMFVNRLPALKIAINYVNDILKKEAFADIIDFANLESADVVPAEVLNLYDTSVDTFIDLQELGTARIKAAVLKVNIVDGSIDTIEILEQGFGYKAKELFDPTLSSTVFKGPPIDIDGNGIGATAISKIDNQGRVIEVVVTAAGKKYTSAIAKIRNYSVLVRTDSTTNNFWSIYAWDDIRRVFFRTQSQSFDTGRYWNLIDWWAAGYSQTTRVNTEISNTAEESLKVVDIGERIRVKEYGAGGWAVFEKIADGSREFLQDYKIIGREKGTIEFDSAFYTASIDGLGYDNARSFDTTYYDVDNSKELRNVLTAIRDDIFVGDYRVEWNKLFFTSVRYAFAEQSYIDWAFKTSFLNATHNVGSLEQKLNYKNDNLESFKEYINEVKPYRTTVREYVSRYDTVEPVGAATSDFDLPPVYSSVDQSIIPVTAGSEFTNTYPWKWWKDNNGFSVVAIEISNIGENYITPPSVVITGNGQGATAQAYISNGKVSAVVVTNAGTGYVSAPSVTLVGGNSAGSAVATAVAVIGDTKVRTFNVTMKFDRVSKIGTYNSFVQTEEFTGSGSSAVFELNYAPTRDKSKINVTKNGQLLLNSDYEIQLYYSYSAGYKLLKGKIIFNVIPVGGLNPDRITVQYEKNDELLDSVNRIQKYYDPSSGMKGNDLSQLMTGIDFGGVQIQGTTFDITGGWDALPWFTDNWDSVESSADHYVVVDGSTTAITLPFVPVDNQQITVYIKRAGGQKTIRIDDPDWPTPTSATAVMPTFIGDGSTSVVEIGMYIETEPEDTLIFRPVESDGSVTITDTNLEDTKLSGGTLSAIDQIYQTASGISAEEIIIDGNNFVSPGQVPAPEENVPGQVLDSVSIKVFTSPGSGAAPLQTNTLVANGSRTMFAIGLTVLESASLIVYVDKIKRDVGSETNDYSIDFVSNQIEFVTAPSIGSIIEIVAIGAGGVGLLDYQKFTADGDTDLFLTGASYEATRYVFVTVDGVYQDAEFIDSGNLTDVPGRTLVQFGNKPDAGATVQIVCASENVDNMLEIVRVNTQTFTFEGSTRSFLLSNFVTSSRGSAESSTLVELNNRLLKGADTNVYIINDEYLVGSNYLLQVGIDPAENPGSVLQDDIRVYINNTLATYIRDYSYNSNIGEVSFNLQQVKTGDTVKIENTLRSEYVVSNNFLTILETVTLTDEDVITATWFDEYASMEIVSDQFTGGRSRFQLSAAPLSDSYVWVYVGGVRQTQGSDFVVSNPRGVVYLKTPADSQVRIISFGSSIFKMPSAFEIHKDMLNIYHYKRYSINDTALSKDLNYYDLTIEVTDASMLDTPIASRNLPGIVLIDGERIEYFQKSGNTLSQLRRGSQGTGIANIHSVGTKVVNVGPAESLPYSESQDRIDLYSDGSSEIVSPLNFIPTLATRQTIWYRDTIPSTHGPCDEIEVFVAGRRLRKDPIVVYNETLGSASPVADETLEAEFSVDGETAAIRLTTSVKAGVRITIIRKTGKIWYERSETTASNGVSLIESDTTVAKFITHRTTRLPE